MKKDNRISRRKFLEYLSNSSFVLAAYGSNVFSTLSFIPKKLPHSFSNYFTSDGEPLLIVVEGKDIKKMLSTGLEALKGFQKLVNGKNLVIKPNVTWSQPYPITTDSALLQGIVEISKDAQCGKITICDGPSSKGLHAHYIFSKLGYFNLRKKLNVDVQCIDPVKKSDFVKVANDKWKIDRTLLISKFARNADVIINTAIPKRHHAADFTCALKNNFGCVYDTFRMYAHKYLSMGNEKGQMNFDRALAEFADAIRPTLTIIDARYMLIKEGPSLKGKAEVKKGINKLIISGDMVAVDSYCARLMEKHDNTFNSKNRVAQQLRYAEELGLGMGDLNKVKIIELNI
jgi:uncharacterized protein (DUF362 family)